MSAEVPPRTKAQKDADNAKEFSGKNVLQTELAKDAKKRGKGQAPKPLDAMKTTRARLVDQELTLKKYTSGTGELSFADLKAERKKSSKESLEAWEREVLKLTKSIETGGVIQGRETQAKDALEVIAKKEEQIAALKELLAKQPEMEKAVRDAEALMPADVHRELAKIQNALDHSDINDGMRDSATARKNLMGIPAGGLEDVPSIEESDEKRTYKGFEYKEIDKKGKERPVTYHTENKLFSRKKETLRAESPLSMVGSAPAEARKPGSEDESIVAAKAALVASFGELLKASRPDKERYNQALNDLVNVIWKEPDIKMGTEHATYIVKGRFAKDYVDSLVEAILPEGAEAGTREKLKRLVGTEFRRRYDIDKKKENDWSMFSTFTRELPHIIRDMRITVTGKGRTFGTFVLGVQPTKTWKQSGLGTEKGIDRDLIMAEERAKSLAKNAWIIPKKSQQRK